MNSQTIALAQEYRPDDVIMLRTQAKRKMEDKENPHRFFMPNVKGRWLTIFFPSDRVRIFYFEERQRADADLTSGWQEWEQREGQKRLFTSYWEQVDTGMTMPTTIRVTWELRLINDFTVRWFAICPELEDSFHKDRLMLSLGFFPRSLEFKYSVRDERHDQQVVRVS